MPGGAPFCWLGGGEGEGGEMGLVIVMKIERVKGRQSWRQREREQGSPLVFIRNASEGSDLASLPINLESSPLHMLTPYKLLCTIYAYLLEAQVQ